MERTKQAILLLPMQRRGEFDTSWRDCHDAQRKSEGLRAFAQSLSTAGLEGILFSIRNLRFFHEIEFCFEFNQPRNGDRFQR